MNSGQRPVAVRVPASTANLGPGFDVLGLALNLHLEAGFGNAPAESNEADKNHPLSRDRARPMHVSHHES